MPIYYSNDFLGTFWRDSSFKELLLDTENSLITWDCENRDENRAYISAQNLIDTETNPITSFTAALQINKLPEGSRGELFIEPGGSTEIILQFPVGSVGELVYEPGDTLKFTYINGVLHWESSYEDTAAQTLAQSELVVLSVDPINGVDDGNHLTAYRTINHTINEIKKLISFTQITPPQNSGYVGDRIFSVEVHLQPGQYNESVFCHYMPKIGIKFIGQGATPADTIIYGDDATDAWKMNGNIGVRLQNLTLNSNKIGLNSINSQDIKITDCNIIIRSVNPKMIFYCIQGSQITIDGTVAITGLVSKVVSVAELSTARLNCAIKPTADIAISEALVSASTGSHALGGSLSIDPAFTLTGNAYSIDLASSVEIPEGLSGLTY